MAPPSLAVITVNWNNQAATTACLRSVLGAHAQNTIAVVIDNASDQNPTRELSASFPSAIVARLPRNLGYAAGCNEGARIALAKGARHLLFLNNDATVDPDAIANLMAAAERHPDAVLAPKILLASDPDRIWSAGGQLRRPWMLNEHIGRGEPSSIHMAPTRLDWATGCALFVSDSTFRRLGPFDEGYFLYLEDVDWCLRAAARQIEVRFVPEAIVYHQVSAAAKTLPDPEVLYYGCRNTYVLAFRHSKWLDRPRLVAGLAATLLKIGLRNLDPAHRTDPRYQARTLAVIDFLRGRRGRVKFGVTP